MLKDPYQQYKQNEVATATPGRLMLMLYNAAIKNLKLSKEGVAEKNITKVNTYMCKVQDIVLELMVSLDLTQGEVAQNLFALYGYMHQRLVDANIKKDVDMMNEVDGMLTELRDTWKSALLKG
ncbi:MAG: flagellar export chaperone FliS [Firmicutes bacterium]|nr:flagellar export chaperone FliS [Bacillota bacterium]